MARGALFSTVFLMVVSLVGAPARAETPEDREKALALVREGNTLLDAGKAAEALAAFRSAYAIVESPKLHFNFGQALAEIPGREAEAHEEFVQYLTQVPTADPVKRAEANRQALALGAKIAFLWIETDPDGVAILVDEKPRGTTPLVGPFALSAGTHALRLSKPGLQPISEAITVTAGQRVTKEFALHPATPRPAAAAIAAAATVPPPTWPSAAKPSAELSHDATSAGAPSIPAAPRAGRAPTVAALTHTDRARPALDEEQPGTAVASAESHSGARIAAMVVAGAGVALGVTGFLVYHAGVTKRDNIMTEASSFQPYNESNGNYATFGDAGLALMAVGGAALATGAVLYLLSPSSSESQPKEPSGPSPSLVYVPRVGTTVQLALRF
jgi:hypothetical protein